MSTLYLVDEYEFFNRKPSKKQIDSCLKNAMEQGSKAVAIIWGENQIDLDYNDSQRMWYGTCLLYTSPSPRDGLLSRMPSSA